MGGGDGEKFQTIITYDNLEDEPKLNLNQVIDNIQVEPIEYIRAIVPLAGIKEPIVTSIVELAHVKNPQFSITQLVLVSSHSIDNLRQICMFLEQAVQNATTWSRTLDEFANLVVEFEQIKKNLSTTSNG
jgi:hypothetical protein